MKYKKKPVVIDAVKVVYAEMLAGVPECFPFDEEPEWLSAAIQNKTLALSTRGARDYAVIAVKTGHGTAEATPGDFIVRGVAGELYPCNPDIFAATYEAVVTPGPAPKGQP